MDWTQQFHLVATLLFVLGSAAVGIRLVLLARRTRERPELLLGLAILGTAVLGYGVLIAGMVVRGSSALGAADEVPALAVTLSAVGQTLHDLGVTCFFLFILQVFRRQETWARALTALAMLLLWGGMLFGAATGAFRQPQVGSIAWWCEYAVIWTYPIWLGVESLRYWSLLRRRAALGLADPLVTNRFWLWGIGSVFSALAIWTASIPFLLVGDPELSVRLAPFIHITTAWAGLVSVSCSYLAFLPPGWYARHISAEAAA